MFRIFRLTIATLVIVSGFLMLLLLLNDVYMFLNISAYVDITRNQAFDLTLLSYWCLFLVQILIWTFDIILIKIKRFRRKRLGCEFRE